MYYLIILLCMAAISVLDLLFAAPAFGFDVPFILLTVCLNVVAVIAVDGISAFVVRWLLPKKWFGTDRKRFAAGKKESRFLERVGIKKWKDKIPELGGFTSFHKKKNSRPEKQRIRFPIYHGSELRRRRSSCGYRLRLFYRLFISARILPVFRLARGFCQRGL